MYYFDNFVFLPEDFFELLAVLHLRFGQLVGFNLSPDGIRTLTLVLTLEGIKERCFCRGNS